MPSSSPTSFPTSLRGAAAAPRWIPGLLLLGGLGLLTPDIPTLSVMVAGLAVLFPVLDSVSRRRRAAGEEPAAVTSDAAPLLWVFLLTLLYLGGRGVRDVWFFYDDWSPWPVGHSFDAGSYLLRSLAIALPVGIAAAWTRHRFSSRLFAGLFILSALLCAWNLWRVTEFEPIHRVDHPSFLYRLDCFAETFPKVSFYDPTWNAGRPVPFLVASGTWTLGLPALPLLKTIPITTLYTPLVGLVLIALVPGLGYVSTRLLGGSRRAAWICALLFLVPGKRYFVHALHYGTTPSMLSLSLAVPCLALLYRVLEADTVRRLARNTAALTLGLAWMLCWPGALLTAVPFAAALLSRPGRLRPRTLLWLAAAALTLVLLLHRMALVPMVYSQIGDFTTPHEPAGFTQHLRQGGARLLELLISSHPLTVIAGFFWFLADDQRGRGRFLGVFFLACALLAGWGEEWFPLLQSERLMIPADFTGALLAGFLIDRTLAWFAAAPSSRERFRSSILRVAGAWYLALLALGGHIGSKFYANRGPADYQTQPDYMEELIGILRERVPEGSRVLIAGKAVHGYGGAKVAALPLFIGREMMACDYYGFSPKLVEYQYPPRRVIQQGPDAAFEFITLHNVSHVITYHAGWKEALDRHPDYYERVRDIEHISVYRVLHPPSPLIGGVGSVSAGFDRITVDLDEPADQVVVRYNWDPGWTVPPPAELFVHEAGYDVRFIGIRPNGLRRLELEHAPPWR